MRKKKKKHEYSEQQEKGENEDWEKKKAAGREREKSKESQGKKMRFDALLICVMRKVREKGDTQDFLSLMFSAIRPLDS